MTATKTREYAGRAERTPKAEKPDFCSTVASEVLERLGTPSDLHKVKAVNVFGNTYRVNVFRELPAGTYITDSFFVHASDKGELVNAKINKKYPE